MRVKRTRQWIAVAIAALLSSAPLMDLSAAIAPPRLGTCKPAADEPPADGKGKASNPGTGNKGETRPAVTKPAKSDKPI
jgi:hypothetical protein